MGKIHGLTEATFTVLEEEKVRLPKKIAEVLDVLNKNGYLASYKLRQLLDNNNDEIKKFINPNYGGKPANLITLARAIVHGYEVEKTPEEKARELFEADDKVLQSSHIHHDLKVRSANRRVAMREVLDALGIKVEGINK